jgi:MinD superfamily P-loop ATPase
MFVFWSTKGGSGTTVSACALALHLAAKTATTLVDLAGDVPAALGVSPVTDNEDSALGVGDWLGSSHATPASLVSLGVDCGDRLRVLTRGTHWPTAPSFAALAEALGTVGGHLVVDAGCGEPAADLVSDATSLLVVRPCFLALRRAALVTTRIDGIVVVNEPGRALRLRDVQHALDAPIMAEIAYDPAIARAVDAGLLRARPPRSLSHAVRSVAA